MKICKGIYLEVVGAGCWVSRGLMLEDEAQRPPSYLDKFVFVEIRGICVRG